MIRGGKSTACHTNVLSQDTAWKLWIMSWPFGQSLWPIHQTIFQICLHDPTAAIENGFILSLDSSLVPLWGWILQTVVDSLGTSLQQVKICTHITTEKLRFKRLSGNSARYELATRSVVSVLIFTLVCIYVANIGLSYAEAKERQSLNASRMFRHIQTWNIQIWHIYFCLKYL